MSNLVKVILIVGALVVLLLAVAVGLGVYWVRRHGPGMVEGAQKAVAEGAEYGRGVDSRGCLEETVARQKRAAGFTDYVGNNLFLRGCLEASRPAPGFCDGVPGPTEFVGGFKWQAQQCARYGLTTQQQCGQLFAQVQQFCHARSHGRPSVSP